MGFMADNNIGASSPSLSQKVQAHFKKDLELLPDSEYAFKKESEKRSGIGK